MEGVGDYGLHEVCYVCQNPASMHDLMMRQVSGVRQENADIQMLNEAPKDQLLRGRSNSNSADIAAVEPSPLLRQNSLMRAASINKQIEATRKKILES